MVTSGRVGDPRTGVTIGYSQTFSAFNQSGKYCSVYVELEILDGAHFGRPQCRQNYSIKLSPLSGQAESGTILSSIEPDRSTGSLVAKVYDNNGQLVPNAKVKLVVDVQRYSGGHQHDEGRHSNGVNENRVGRLAPYPGTTATISDNGKVLEGNTGQNGLRFTFAAPVPAGDHKITASCTDGKNCQPEGPDTVWVGHKGLQPLNDNNVYILLPNNNDPKHPDNHNLTLTAASRMAVFAAMYHGKYPNLSVLQLNDASLERGGIFDLRHDWKAPHHEHCGGSAIDIRANGVNGALNITGDGVHTTNDGTVHPADPMIDKLQTIADAVGADAVWEVPKDSNGNFVWNARHFHTRLTGQEGLTCP